VLVAIPEIRAGSVACALLAVHHAGLSEGVRSLLSLAVPTLVLVADEASLLAAAIRLRPVLAVVDIGLIERDVPAILHRLRESCPEMKVILLDPHGLANGTRRRLVGEASAIVPVSEIGARLLPAVDAILAGEPAQKGAT
jgi:DNA-binding NarL/FixJ family response regulator